MNRSVLGAGIAIVALAGAMAFPASSGAGGVFEPQPPDYLIEIVEGIPLVLAIPELPPETDSVRFEVDGVAVQTNEFEPFDEGISTTRLVRRGIVPEEVHRFTVWAVSLFEGSTLVGDYRLQIHRMPVIDRVHIYPLVVRKHPRLAGFQLRGIRADSQVKAWARGLRFTTGYFPLPLKRVKRGPLSRTYRVPGGFEWRRGTRPHLIFSIVPKGRIEHGVYVRGRIYKGLLRTNRAGDTVIRHIDDWDLCTASLTRRGNRPPRRTSCDHF